MEDTKEVVSKTFIQNESLAKDEKSLRLRLPSRDLIVYEEVDIEILSHINNEDDFVAVMREYVLGTVAESIRLIEGIPLDSSIMDALQFRRYSHLCTAHHARWDILALVGALSFLLLLFVLIVLTAR